MCVIGLARNTTIAWKKLLWRSVCPLNEECVGGPGKVVEVDESKFGEGVVGIQRDTGPRFVLPVGRKYANSTVPENNSPRYHITQ